MNFLIAKESQSIDHISLSLPDMVVDRPDHQSGSYFAYKTSNSFRHYLSPHTHTRTPDISGFYSNEYSRRHSDVSSSLAGLHGESW